MSAAEFAVTSPGEEAGRKAQVKPSDNVLQRPVHNPGPAPPKADQNLTPPAKSKAPKQGDDKPSKPKKESDKQGPLGDAPRSVDDLFVSQSAILLKPGETQIDVGFVYSWQDAQGVVLRAVPGGTVVTTDRRRARRFLVPTNIRHGFTENLELFFSAPFGFSQFERSDPFQLFEDSQGGISDISAGFQYQLQKQTDKKPDITATFRVTAPTGSGSATIQGANLNLGRGFWGLQGELNFIKTYDPIVLFSRVGYRHEFAGERFNLSVQPGETFNYSFGMGFAISDQIAVNAAVNGQFQGRTILAGRSVPNSSTEPISMLFSLTRRTSKMTRVQPFIEFGLTDDAADATFGIVFIRNFEPLCGIAK